MKEVFAQPAAAKVLGAKLIGRIINNVARGFGEDVVLSDEMCVYRALFEKYPEDIVAMPTMLKTMLERAIAKDQQSHAGFDQILSTMTDKERELWQQQNGSSEREQLLAAMKPLSELYVANEPDLERWYDLPVIAQWSLLYALETGLQEARNTYEGWIARSPHSANTKAKRLIAEVDAATPVVFDYITTFLDDDTVKMELAAAAEAGIAVRQREAA